MKSFIVQKITLRRIVQLYVQAPLKTNTIQGYALPMALMFGLITMTLMTLVLVGAQSNRASSKIRQDSVNSAIVADSAIARVLVELSKPENSGLLVRNYDPINPDTGNTYLGDDGITNSGDENSNGVDEWTSYDPSGKPCYQEKGISAPSVNLSGTIGSEGTYRLLAYRYNTAQTKGTVLIEGNSVGSRSHILVSLSIHPNLEDFPGIGLIQPHDGINAGVIALRGRKILGKNGNIYFVTSHTEPLISGRAEPNDVDHRPQFLSAIWSSDKDGNNNVDNVSGVIIACELNINIPKGITGTNFGIVNSSQTLSGTGGQIRTLYRLEKIDLAGNDTLLIDTTGGPVTIDMIFNGVIGSESITLKDSAKIVNMRTDGQPPKVGDVRIFLRESNVVALYHKSCIQQVFLYSALDELRLLTDAPGCSGGQNINFEGVVWAEAILSSKNSPTNRDVSYLGFTGQNYDTLVTQDAYSGISVPDDVSSLVDLLKYTDFPIDYRYEEILIWQNVSL